MSTAVTPVTPRLVPLAPVASEALIEQLLGARVKLERGLESFRNEAQERVARERREFAEQAAQLIDAAPAPVDPRLVDTLAARLKSLHDSEEKLVAGLDVLQRSLAAIQERIEALKKSAADRELLIKVLKRQYDRLQEERARRQDEAQDLTEIIERLEQDLSDLTGSDATAKSTSRGRKA